LDKEEERPGPSLAEFLDMSQKINGRLQGTTKWPVEQQALLLSLFNTLVAVWFYNGQSVPSEELLNGIARGCQGLSEVGWWRRKKIMALATGTIREFDRSKTLEMMVKTESDLEKFLGESGSLRPRVLMTSVADAFAKSDRERF
jgi:hypothetical protein